MFIPIDNIVNHLLVKQNGGFINTNSFDITSQVTVTYGICNSFLFVFLILVLYNLYDKRFDYSYI